MEEDTKSLFGVAESHELQVIFNFNSKIPKMSVCVISQNGLKVKKTA